MKKFDPDLAGTNKNFRVALAMEKIKSLELKISNMEQQANFNNLIKNKDKINKGKFYAILFANYKYKYMNNLITPEKDIDELQKVLNSRYGFQTYVIKNANEESMIAEITKLNNKISSNDHLLIYYAGHGVLMKMKVLHNRCKLNNESKWLSNAYN